MVAALFAAFAPRPADRILAAAAAVLVVGGAGGTDGPLDRPTAACAGAVLRRRFCDARRRLHLERHYRSRSRREGRADAVAADPGRTSQRAGGVRLSGRAGTDRPCG